MSSSDRAATASRRSVRAGIALLALAVAGGCTVQPLYRETTAAIGTQGTTGSRLAMVGIDPINDRVGQEVRNHLIFLFGGGSGQPANPAYGLDLLVSYSSSKPATIETRQVSLAPTSGVVILRGRYRLTEKATGKLISAGARTVQAPFDLPQQDYAALRAERNAQDRAARELAELLRLVIAQELEKPTSVEIPDISLSPEEIEAQDAPGEAAGL